MQIDIKELSFRISVNLLHQYVTNQIPEIKKNQQLFLRDCTQSTPDNLPRLLVNFVKNGLPAIQQLFKNTEEFFNDLALQPVYQFYQICFRQVSTLCKWLSSALSQKMNQNFQFMHKRIYQPEVKGIVGTTEVSSDVTDRQYQLQKIAWKTSQNLQSLNYFLNSFSYEQEKGLEQYRAICEKMLLKKQDIENIKASLATKEIQETANMIDQTVNRTDKIFKDSYMLKYIEFQSGLAKVQEPHQLIKIFKQEMQSSTKDKFKDTVANAVIRLGQAVQHYKSRRRLDASSQTQDASKNKNQQKLQNLLILQRQNNQRLKNEVNKLNLTVSRLTDAQNYAKIKQREENLRKQAERKYNTLELLYHQKCQELKKNTLSSLQNPVQRPQNKPTKSMAVQTSIKFATNTDQQATQTDSHFYYHFQQEKIQSYQKKIRQLEQQLNKTKHQINEMEAIKTFRDHFKSRKQIYSTVIKSKSAKIAKSLHYLDVDSQDQIYDEKSDLAQMSIGKGSIQKYGRDSIQRIKYKDAAPRKKVTLQDDSQSTIFLQRRKTKKTNEENENKPYFDITEKVQNQVKQNESQKPSETIHKISLKSILKAGVGQQGPRFKECQVQTDQVVFASNKRQSYLRGSKSSIYSKKKEQFTRISQSIDLDSAIRRTQLESNRQSKQFQSNLLSFQGNLQKLPQVKHIRQQQSSSKQKRIPKKIKYNNIKMNTEGNQLLHINNTLNFKMFQTRNSGIKPSNNSFNASKVAPPTIFNDLLRPGKIRRKIR